MVALQNSREEIDRYALSPSIMKRANPIGPTLNAASAHGSLWPLAYATPASRGDRLPEGTKRLIFAASQALRWCSGVAVRFAPPPLPQLELNMPIWMSL